MKIAVFFSLATLVFAPKLQATESWTWQNPLPQGNRLAATFFLNADTGWIAGNTGTLFKTTDGGSSWSRQPAGTWGNLNAIQFINRDTGWAVGDSGIIVKTGDGGASWSRQNSGTGRRLFSLQFANRDTGWAVGDTGTVRKTTDGGATWTPQSLGTVSARLTATRFTDGNRGWIAADDGVIRKTLDGGSHWVTQSSGTTYSLNTLFFMDSSKGFAGGSNGTLLQTTNGGDTWMIRSGVTGSYLSSIYFASATAGWAVSYNNNPGQIMRTTDGGATWGSQTSGITQALYSVHFATATRGWAVGADGVILKTTNGGANWTSISTGNPQTGTSDYLSAVSFVGTTHGWVVGTGPTIYKTTNGGATWTGQSNSAASYYSGIQFLDVNHGWFRSTGMGTTTTGIYSTSNGGATWVSKAGGATGFSGSLFFVDTNTGWTGGGSNIVLKTTNGGSSWISQSLGTIITRRAEQFHFADANRGWAVGNISSSGAIFRTTNGGTTWTNQTFSQTTDMLSVSFISPTQGWAVGYATNGDSFIFKTTDGGTNWSSQVAPRGPYGAPVLFSVRFIDANTGWISQGKGFLKTTDGGSTWTPQSSGTDNTLEALYFADVNTGWAVGENHTILKYSNDAVPSAPLPLSPASNSQNIPLSTALSWSAPSSAIAYRLQLSADSAFATVLVDDSALTTPSRGVSSLVIGTPYYWRVNALNAYGTSPWSAAMKFTTIPAAPAVPTLATPAANATGVAINGTLVWNAAAGAATYRVQLSTDSTFATALINDSSLTLTVRVTGTLAHNTTYYWRINAKNAGGTSAYSETRKFATTPPTALIPAGFVFQRAGIDAGGMFRFGLPRPARVKIVLFDTKGNTVRTVLDEERKAGYHAVLLPSPETLKGSYYLLDFRAGGYHKTFKLNP